MIRSFVLFFGLLFFCSGFTRQAFAAGKVRKHLIYFKDKANTPFSVSQPERFLSERALERRSRQGIAVTQRDLPVNPQYVAALRATGAEVWYTSKWFNAAVVQCDSAVLAALQVLPFVKTAQTLNRTAYQKNIPVPAEARPDISGNRETARSQYGKAFSQANMLGATDLHAAGFRGEDMVIAVFDAGFPNVNTIQAFSHLFENDQVKGTFDFVNKKQSVYDNNQHGTNVLSTMAAYQPGRFIGTAYKAGYYLFITEDAPVEHNIEEVNWLLAAEFADSAGADVINSSLGYTTFDAPSRSYTTQEMNGNTALVTKAADLAAATGMLIVTSAGNEGNNPAWRIISAPADGDSVLSVGAVDSLGNKAGFSSFGPSADGRVKPDVAAQGGFAWVIDVAGNVNPSNGTSFSGPILCGMAACFWQANRSLSNMEIIRLLQKSGHQAGKPDERLGYGIPNFKRAQEVMSAGATVYPVFPNPIVNDRLTLQLDPAFMNQSVEITIYDMVGKKVYQESFLTDIQINHFNLNNPPMVKGTYFGVIKGANKNQSFRFLKI